MQKPFSCDSYMPAKLSGVEEEVFFLVYYDSRDVTGPWTTSEHFSKEGFRSELARMGHTEQQTDSFIAHASPNFWRM